MWSTIGRHVRSLIKNDQVQQQVISHLPNLVVVFTKKEKGWSFYFEPKVQKSDLFWVDSNSSRKSFLTLPEAKNAAAQILEIMTGVAVEFEETE